MWKTVGADIGRYRNYPRIVGETGGKDFIVAHPSADLDALAAAIVRGSFEYQGQKCSAASRVYAPSNLWPELRERLAERGRDDHAWATSADFSNFMGAVIDGALVRDAARGDRGGARARGDRDRRRRRHRRLARLLRRADRDRDARPRLPAAARRALRPGRDDVRLRRGRLGRHARPGRRDRAVRADRRRVRRGPRARSRRRRTACATRPATSTSTTSRPAPSSASSRSAARAPPARTTRPARCGT